MKNLRLILVLLLFCGGIVLADEVQRPATRPATSQPSADDGIRVYFSPHGGCTSAIVEQIKAAKKSIDMQAYSFTSIEIARAIADAHERGVKVRAILDRKASGSQYSGATYLFNHGIETWTDGKHPIAHNKIMIIDGATIITGSFSFTKQAESNAENLLIFSGKASLAEAYERNFEEHLGHSTPYEGVKKEDK